MKSYSAIALMAVLSIVTAEYPYCAVQCINSAITSTTSCSTTDLACMCENASAVGDAATGCVISSCSTADALATQQQAGEMCANLESSPAASSAPSTISNGASPSGSSVASVTPSGASTATSGGPIGNATFATASPNSAMIARTQFSALIATGIAAYVGL
ncbi:hypothetical protein O988_05639 [Pseudogymnoascus sp. VKM F-3808]|nr:hypothetical protein O988_05639 [Pseudogymnoascus sp. VKM F-3808]